MWSPSWFFLVFWVFLFFSLPRPLDPLGFLIFKTLLAPMATAKRKPQSRWKEYQMENHIWHLIMISYILYTCWKNICFSKLLVGLFFVCVFVYTYWKRSLATHGSTPNVTAGVSSEPGLHMCMLGICMCLTFWRYRSSLHKHVNSTFEYATPTPTKKVGACLARGSVRRCHDIQRPNAPTTKGHAQARHEKHFCIFSVLLYFQCMCWSWSTLNETAYDHMVISPFSWTSLACIWLQPTWTHDWPNTGEWNRRNGSRNWNNWKHMDPWRMNFATYSLIVKT